MPSLGYNVYCYSEGAQGHTMSLVQTLATVEHVTTKCCGSVVFSTFAPKIPAYYAGASDSVFVLSLNTIPSVNTIVNVIVNATNGASCSSSSKGVASQAAAIPSTLTFAASTTSLTAQFVIRGTQGCYQVLATARGVQQFNSVKQALVIENPQSPSAPVLTSAVFSNDGLSMLVNFDVATDRGAGAKIPFSFSASFACSSVLVFTGAPKSSCLWSNPTQIIATFEPYSTSVVALGSKVSVVANTLQAGSCAQGIQCLYTNSSIVKHVLAPANPVAPIVSLSAPTLVGGCNDIVIDPTQSSGQGGRSWAQLSWSLVVQGNPLITQANVNSIVSMLTSQYSSTSGLATVPNNLLKDGTYVISLSLTNFLGAMSVGSVSVTFSKATVIPSLSIAGPSVVQVSRWQPVTVFAVATVPKCGNISKYFSYSWGIFSNGVQVNGTRSISVDPTVLILSPYTLLPSHSYTARVTVTVPTISGSSVARQASASVALQVISSGIFASIAGGSKKTISLADPVFVDASGSYDLDFPSLLLNYSWSCAEITPNFGARCLQGHVLGRSSIIAAPAGALPLGSYLIKVIVSDGTKVSSSSVTISVISNQVPSVSITVTEVKFNPTDNVIITGVISANVSSSWARWNSSSCNLAKVAATPLTLGHKKGYYSYQLAIPAGRLTPGLTYTFELDASYSSAFSGGTGSSQISVVMNAPAYGGIVSASPTSGVALSTSFYISTSKWVDSPSDYPLSYILSYYVLTPSLQIVMKSADVISYMNSLIGQGLSANGYGVTLVGTAVDAYGCKSSATGLITVSPQTNLQLLAKAATQQLSNAIQSQNPTAVSQAIGAVTQSLNAVNCTVPRNCSAINREICSFTPHTCGKCLSGYLGVDGASNVPCSRPSSLKVNGQACISNTNCINGLCRGGVCASPMKQCVNNCTRNGVCVFQGVYTGATLSTCSTSDSLCTAKCVCRKGYGGAGCQFNATQLSVILKTRDAMCVGLYASTMLQNVDESVIRSRTSSIASILLDVTQVTQAGIGNCSAALVATVMENRYIAGVEDIAHECTEAFSAVLQLGSELPRGLLKNISDAMSVLSLGMQGNLAVGQTPATLITSNARVVAAVVDSSVYSGGAFQCPQTSSEAFQNHPTNSLALADGAVGPVGISVVQYTNNPHGAKTNATSLGFNIMSYAASDSGGRRRLAAAAAPQAGAIIVLQNTVPVDLSRAVVNGTVSCQKASAPYNVTKRCPHDQTVSILCRGSSAGEVAYFCPSRYVEPKCVTWDGVGFSVNPTCRVVAATTWNVTCHCGGQAADAAALGRLSQSESLRELSALGTEIGSNFLNTWKSLGKFNLATLQRNLTVFITVGIIVVLFFAGLILLSRWDSKEKKAQVEQKKQRKFSGRMVTFEKFLTSLTPAELMVMPWYTKLWNKLTIDVSLKSFRIFPTF